MGLNSGLNDADQLRRRVVPAIVLVVSGGVLALAAALQASPTGLGTHTQLGLAVCGFYQRSGVPCATCGMTTAFSHAADGRLDQALLTQPAGAVLAVLTAMAGIISAYALATGMRLEPVVGWCVRPRTIVAMIVLVLGSWGYKIIISR